MFFSIISFHGITLTIPFHNLIDEKRWEGICFCCVEKVLVMGAAIFFTNKTSPPEGALLQKIDDARYRHTYTCWWSVDETTQKAVKSCWEQTEFEYHGKVITFILTIYGLSKHNVKKCVWLWDITCNPNVMMQTTPTPSGSGSGSGKYCTKTPVIGYHVQERVHGLGSATNFWSEPPLISSKYLSCPVGFWIWWLIWHFWDDLAGHSILGWFLNLGYNVNELRKQFLLVGIRE